MRQGLFGSKSKRNVALTQIALQLIRERKPQSVQELVDLVKEETSLPEQEIIEHVMWLQTQGKITLHEQPGIIPEKLTAYLGTKEARWYWITLIVTTAAVVTIFMLPEDAYPVVYIRYLLGTIFVTWMPGYSIIKALFPTEPPFKTSAKSLEFIERVALSIGISWALVPMVGLALNFTPWGIDLSTIVFSLFALTVVSATIGIIRGHKSDLENTPKTEIELHV